MTESDWQDGSYPERMLVYLHGRASNRKLRLLACAWVRCLWDSIEDDAVRRAVEVAERFADDLAGERERQSAWMGVRELTRGAGLGDSRRHWQALAAGNAAHARIQVAVREVARCVAEAAGERARQAVAENPWGAGAWQARRAAVAGMRDTQGRLVREVFGNPLRPPPQLPALPPEVLAFARTMYAGRAFDGMPQLGDALEEAGCADAEVLAHCRGVEGHVRGCWVLDLVLGNT
jgi:hypothetical protein